MVVFLSACAGKEIPLAVNSYCPVKETEKIDMTDPALQTLTPKNQGAVLTGDDNYRVLCLKRTPTKAP